MIHQEMVATREDPKQSNLTPVFYSRRASVNAGRC
jgi:hypothetical protein